MNDLRLLCRNAWLLMDLRNAIRTHEDWCRIPVNIMPDALPQPTIDAYLDFWEGEGCVECSHDSNAAGEGVMIGTLGLICEISDNPDTGNNCCRVAWGDGKVTTESLSALYRDFYPTSLGNLTPEEPSEHNLAWLIQQVKNLKK